MESMKFVAFVFVLLLLRNFFASSRWQQGEAEHLQTHQLEQNSSVVGGSVAAGGCVGVEVLEAADEMSGRGDIFHITTAKELRTPNNLILGLESYHKLLFFPSPNGQNGTMHVHCRILSEAISEFLGKIDVPNEEWILPKVADSSWTIYADIIRS